MDYLKKSKVEIQYETLTSKVFTLDIRVLIELFTDVNYLSR